ncbi:MAG: hypothetical protein R2844_19880 [Caldilineales bacterium]
MQTPAVRQPRLGQAELAVQIGVGHALQLVEDLFWRVVCQRATALWGSL